MTDRFVMLPAWLAAVLVANPHHTRKSEETGELKKNYLNEEQETQDHDQVMNIHIGPAPFIPIQYNPFHTTQQYISLHSFPLLSIP